MQEVQIEDNTTAVVGTMKLRNSTGNAIRVSIDEDGATLSVVACCIGEGHAE